MITMVRVLVTGRQSAMDLLALVEREAVEHCRPTVTCFQPWEDGVLELRQAAGPMGADEARLRVFVSELHPVDRLTMSDGSTVDYFVGFCIPALGDAEVELSWRIVTPIVGAAVCRGVWVHPDHYFPPGVETVGRIEAAWLSLGGRYGYLLRPGELAALLRGGDTPRPGE